MELEKRGVPTLTICTDDFEALARAAARGLRMPELPLLILPHPIGGRPVAELDRLVSERLELIIGAVTAPAARERKYG